MRAPAGLATRARCPPTLPHTPPPPTKTECLFSGYSFYVLYIFQMVVPFVCVAFCVATYHAADLALRRLDPAGAQRRRLARARSAAAAAAAEGGAGGDAAAGGRASASSLPPPSRLVAWLEGLKLR